MMEWIKRNAILLLILALLIKMSYDIILIEERLLYIENSSEIMKRFMIMKNIMPGQQ